MIARRIDKFDAQDVTISGQLSASQCRMEAKSDTITNGNVLERGEPC